MFIIWIQVLVQIFQLKQIVKLYFAEEMELEKRMQKFLWKISNQMNIYETGLSRNIGLLNEKTLVNFSLFRCEI